MLFVGDTSTGLKSIGAATSASIEISMDTKETTTKDSASGHWATMTANKLSWSASSDNLFSTTPDGNGYDDLYDMMVARKPVYIKFAQTTNTFVAGSGWTPTTSYYSGQAFITSLSMTASAEDNAQFSV